MKTIFFLVHFSIVAIFFISLILLYIDLLNIERGVSAKNKEINKLLNANFEEKLEKLEKLFSETMNFYRSVSSQMKLDNILQIATVEGCIEMNDRKWE